MGSENRVDYLVQTSPYVDFGWCDISVLNAIARILASITTLRCVNRSFS